MMSLRGGFVWKNGNGNNLAPWNQPPFSFIFKICRFSMRDISPNHSYCKHLYRVFDRSSLVIGIWNRCFHKLVLSPVTSLKTICRSSA